MTDDHPGFGPPPDRPHFIGAHPQRHRRDRRRLLDRPLYPPFTDIREWPLHQTLDNPTEYWFPCKVRGYDWSPHCLWDWRCEPCVRHARQTLDALGDFIIPWTLEVRSTPLGERPLSWLVRRGEYYAGDDGFGDEADL